MLRSPCSCFQVGFGLCQPGQGLGLVGPAPVYAVMPTESLWRCSVGIFLFALKRLPNSVPLKEANLMLRFLRAVGVSRRHCMGHCIPVPSVYSGSASRGFHGCYLMDQKEISSVHPCPDNCYSVWKEVVFNECGNQITCEKWEIYTNELHFLANIH